MNKLLTLALFLLTAWRADAQPAARVRPPVKSPDCNAMPSVGRTVGELCANNTNKTLYYWSGVQWEPLGAGTGGGPSPGDSYDYIMSIDQDGSYQLYNTASSLVVYTAQYANQTLQFGLDLCYPEGCSIKIKPGTYTYETDGLFPETYLLTKSPRFRAGTNGWTYIHGDHSIFQVTRTAPNFIMPNADIDGDGTVSSPYGTNDTDDHNATYNKLEIKGIHVQGLTPTEPLRGPVVFGTAWAEGGYQKNYQDMTFRDIIVDGVNNTFDYNGDGSYFEWYDPNHDGTATEDFNGDGIHTYAGDHDAGLNHPLGIQVSTYKYAYGTASVDATPNFIKNILIENVWMEGTHNAVQVYGNVLIDSSAIQTSPMNAYADNININGVYWDMNMNMNSYPYALQQAIPSDAIQVGQSLTILSTNISNVISKNSGDNHIEINNYVSANISNVYMTDARFTGIFLTNYSRLYGGRNSRGSAANITNVTKENLTGIFTNRAPQPVVTYSGGSYNATDRPRVQNAQQGTINITNVTSIDANTTKTPPNTVVYGAGACAQRVNIKNLSYFYPNSKIEEGLQWDGPVTIRCDSGPGMDYDGTTWTYTQPGEINIDGVSGYVDVDKDGTGLTQYIMVLIDAMNAKINLSNVSLNLNTTGFSAADDFGVIWLSPNALQAISHLPIAINNMKVKSNHPGTNSFLSLSTDTIRAVGYPIQISNTDLSGITGYATFTGVADYAPADTHYPDISIVNSKGLPSVGSQPSYTFIDPNGDSTLDYKFATTVCDPGEVLTVQADATIGCGSAGLPPIHIMEDYNSTATANGFLVEQSASCNLYRLVAGAYPDRDPVTDFSSQAALDMAMDADGAQCVIGYSGLDTSSSFLTTTGTLQPRKLIEFNVRAGFVANTQTGRRFLLGGIRTKTDKDYLTKQAGLFFWWDPRSDIDNDGTAGDADNDGSCGEAGEDDDDCNFYACAMNNGTGFAGDDTTLSNNTNTTCSNMGWGSGERSETQPMNRFSIKKVGATYQFAIYNENGLALGAAAAGDPSNIKTISTNIPAVDEKLAFWGIVTKRVSSTGTAVIMDYWEYVGNR